MSPHTAQQEPVLAVRDVVKTFPGVRALDGVSLDLRRGEVHALVGENGAGKSTLIHLLAGVYQPDAGEILLHGRPVRFPNPQSAARAGIGVVFQELSLAGSLSIAENVFAHRQPAGRLGLIDWRELHRRTREMLALFDWEADPGTPVRDLPAAKQQVVEILKALSLRPAILVLDEPTSSLTAAETQQLFAIIRRLEAQGTSFLCISHHLPEVFQIADRVTVLRDGRRVDTCPVADVDEDGLVRRMVGRALTDVYGRRTGPLGAARLELTNGARGGAFRDVSLSVRAGEIVGLAGLAGAGRTELGRAIFGAEPLDEGRIALDGKPLRVRSPAEAIANRIAYLTEARKEDGLFLDMPVRANCVAPNLGAFASRAGLVDEARITDRAEECQRRFGIAATSVWQEVGQLSGGNQQKVLLAMWLGIRPLVLIADEPTRGVDVGARSEIYRLLRDLAAGGAAVLLISSDLPEVLGLSDRVLVMRAGRLVAELADGSATEEAVIAAAAGVGPAVSGLGLRDGRTEGGMERHP